MAELLAELERRLARLRETRSDLDPGALALQGALIRARLEMLEPDLPGLRLPAEVALERLRSRTPLLHQAPAFVDVGWAAGLFGRLVEVAAEHSAESHALQTALDEGLLDTESLFQEAFVQHREHVAHLASEAEVDADQLFSLAWLAVSPMLAGYARQLQPYLDRGLSVWDRGYCPVCGAWPILGELRGVELAQFLRCGSCGAGWRSRRLFCPYCGTDDYHLLQTLQVEGEQRFRLSVCERCHGYLKVGNAFDPPPAALVVLDDVASLHLDVAAIERGYQRPTGAGFRLELAVPESSEELLELDD
jgi:FdhE protein